MKNSLILLSFVMLATSNTYASRQLISCRNEEGYKLSANFDPSKKIETVWKKDQHGDYIQTIILGNKDTKTTTTAKVFLTVPSSEFKKPYYGKFQYSEFYEVNISEEANSGYSYKFDGGPYQSFHGHDQEQHWDMMFYFDNSALGKNSKSFRALTTIQMDLMDQGYLHIDLKCSSKIQK